MSSQLFGTSHVPKLITDRDNRRVPRLAAMEKPRYTYNDVHNIIKDAAPRVAEFKPDMLIAIGMETFLVGMLLALDLNRLSPGGG
jgi:hypothetical protein